MNSATDLSAEELRASMVDRIAQLRGRSSNVIAAMRKVPRHEFLPEATLEDAYAADKAVITKRADDGSALSCSSVPALVATMLDQLDVRPGHHILEIGAGTGINAAYLAELTGPSGQVTTIDIDPQVTAAARRALDTTGYNDVHATTRDGVLGDPEHAPYDRIIVTVGAWDIPPAWWEQLADGGRIVVPLRWRGQTRSIALTRQADRLLSDSVELCGFVPMVGQGGEHSGHIDPGSHVALYWDPDQPIDPTALRDVLNQPKAETWTRVTVGPNESFDGVWLRLTATEAGTCRIAAEPAAIESGLCTPAIPVRSPALVEEDSLAYFTHRRLKDQVGAGRRWELGAAGHGPAGQRLANRLAEQITAWDRDRTAQPTITAYPASTPDHDGAGHVIDKPHTRLVISY